MKETKKLKRPTLPEHCKQAYCLCSGGLHVACKVGKEKDQVARDALLSLSQASRDEKDPDR